MKGVVFTEFQEMVEHHFGMEMYDRLVQQCTLSSGGAYTSIGTYDHAELLQMVTVLSSETGTEVSDLVQAFGAHLLTRFSLAYPQFFERTNSAMDFLASVESYIHVEVRKLYPEAELPEFTLEQIGEDRWEMRYKSSRPFADLAHGLIAATLEHFGEEISLERLDEPAQQGLAARFILTRTPQTP